jgi:hypothetical protein
MDGGSRSCSGVVIVKKKSKKFKFKKLLLRGLGTLISGIVFGAGCLVAEHIDSNWGQSQEASSSETAVRISVQK